MVFILIVLWHTEQIHIGPGFCSMPAFIKKVQSKSANMFCSHWKKSSDGYSFRWDDNSWPILSRVVPGREFDYRGNLLDVDFEGRCSVWIIHIYLRFIKTPLTKSNGDNGRTKFVAISHHLYVKWSLVKNIQFDRSCVARRAVLMSLVSNYFNSG